MKKPIILILIGLGIIVLVQDFLTSKKKADALKPRPYVVIVSLDGFRWDYQDKAITPTLDFITKNGVKATGLQPCFPTKTFPNHYSIATGLYPGNHGIIANSFYAPDIKQYFSHSDVSNVENGKFYKGEPFWVTAEAQGVKTASYFWLGSDSKIKGYRPSYWKKYDSHFPYNQRVDSIISWLKKPYNERPKLITWYLEKADIMGHKFGPDSKEVGLAISELDSVLGYFLKEAKNLDISDSINFIIVSDHGMQTINTEKIVNLEDFLKPTWVDTALGGNPFYLIDAKENCTDSILNKLKGVEGIQAWAKKDIPDRFFLKQNERVPDIVIVADSGWSVQANSDHEVNHGGNHGYDNTMADMNGIFYAIGPNFKLNYNAGQLYNTDIYNLIAKILEIKPAPNDGKTERIFHILNETKKPE